MRKPLFLIFFGGAFFFMAGGVAGADISDLCFWIGASAWHNDFNLGVKRDGFNHSYRTKDAIVMVGPTVRMGYKKIFTSFNYMTSTSDFKFEEVPNDKVSRQDIDAVVGYMFIPEFGLFGGYKGIFAEERYPGGHTTHNKNGLTAGVATNFQFPFRDLRIALYANAAGDYLHQDYRESDTGFSSNHNFYGYTADGGLAWNIVPRLTATVGYKYQALFRTNRNAGDLTSDERYRGVTFGVDYRF